ncbi:UNVERIFIED_CONTAM: hypothetical protein Sradi_0210300 [Sesamum radiatum]|uniref:Uncharacterized protein n=1 Tax=Sesamum radiatum TaxID=300843 RepID=A0AAW2VZ67_SESRA
MKQEKNTERVFDSGEMLPKVTVSHDVSLAGYKGVKARGEKAVIKPSASSYSCHKCSYALAVFIVQRSRQYTEPQKDRWRKEMRGLK